MVRIATQLGTEENPFRPVGPPRGQLSGYGDRFRANMTLKNMQCLVDTAYAAQLDDMLGPALYWNLYRTGHNKDLVTRDFYHYN